MPDTSASSRESHLAWATMSSALSRHTATARALRAGLPGGGACYAQPVPPSLFPMPPFRDRLFACGALRTGTRG